MTTPALKNDEVAAMIGIRPDTLKTWRVQGKGPRYRKIGTSRQGAVYYDRNEVEAWLRAREVQSTSQYGAHNLNGVINPVLPPERRMNPPWLGSAS
jgi:predicted DNA-binding transcriptional regulator AlpA